MTRVPPQMPAIAISAPGGPEVLALVERPTPAPKEGEVLIRVEAAGVNRPDVAQRRGQYAPPLGASDLPGLEVAGRIVALGDGVDRWKIGDAVCALVTGGGYAEYCAAPQEQCLPIPRGLTMAEAASLPETFFTVWSMVWERGRLAPGESLLVHGGSSGIGVAAIQIAHALGHAVYVTAGTEAKCRECEALGATRAIDYRTCDFVAEVRSLTDGRGVDVILDMVAGDYVDRDIAALADDGRIVILAVLGGSRGSIAFDQVLRRRLTITGATLRPRPVEFKGRIAAALREKVWPLLESRRVRPVVHATFPLADAAAAHRLMESSAHVGKIVLEVAHPQ